MENGLLLFVVAFILQFVGHHIGDFLLQTNHQAINKGKHWRPLFNHAMTYSLVTALLIMIVFTPIVGFYVFLITFVEHAYVDRRKPVIAYKNFFDRKIGRDPDFDAGVLPTFVVIGIDQSIHILRIFLVSGLIGLGILS